MKRNTREERLKEIRRFVGERDYWHEQTKIVEKIPFEKPQFAGWDISVTLSESGMRRSDALDLLRILSVTNVGTNGFTKRVNYIKELRRHSYTFQKVSYLAKNGVICWWYGIRNWRGRLSRFETSEKGFNSLPVELRKYFTFDSWNNRRYPWSEKKWYLNRHEFPMYELVFKVTKAYYNFQEIPNGEAESNYRKIKNKVKTLYGRGWEKAMPGRWSTYNKFSRQWYNRKLRNKLHTFCNILVTHQDFSDEFIEDKSLIYNNILMRD